MPTFGIGQNTLYKNRMASLANFTLEKNLHLLVNSSITLLSGTTIYKPWGLIREIFSENDRAMVGTRDLGS